jgi:G3E family GTPase
MRPYITGSKPKEERKRAFCIGAKRCSGKAATDEEAAQLCSNPAPKLIDHSLSKKDDPCVSTISMRDWIQQPGDGKVCRPCLLGPVIQWYSDVLKEKGLGDLATEVVNAVEEGEIVAATKLDEVKDKVSPEVKARLREFDCQAQLYKGEEDGK